MKIPVIIPVTKLKYDLGFSAPLTWLFAEHRYLVEGVYSFDFTLEQAKSHNTFIIELNWYIELYEFTLLVNFIKKYNPGAKILFGGLFASLQYREIFDRYPVDYFIKGDNEVPIKMFLDGIKPEKIPNFTGRDFENDQTYIFREKDFKELQFSMDWFPSFFKYLTEEELKKSQGYRFPIVFTSKGGCTAVHKGCEYCMGSKHKELEKIYRRKPITMSNSSLMSVLNRLDKQFNTYSIYFLSPYNYDFSGQYFKKPAVIEIDSPVKAKDIENLFKAFKECELLLPLYEEGIMGETVIDCREIVELEDENHRIFFPCYTYHKDLVKKIPKKNILWDLHNLFSPDWAHWEAYKNFSLAFKNSKTIYNYYIKKERPLFNPSKSASRILKG